MTWNFPVISEPFVSTLALDLVAAREEVRVLTFDTCDTGGAVERMHPEIAQSDLLARIGRAGAALPFGSLIGGNWSVRKLLSGVLPVRPLGRAKLALGEGQFDVVHCQFASLALAANGLRRARLLSTRALVVHLRGYDITTFVRERGARCVSPVVRRRQPDDRQLPLLPRPCDRARLPVRQDRGDRLPD